jgi:superfamily II RNA helicase
MNFLHIPDISKCPDNIPPHPYNFPLDPFQQHAITAISKNENVLVCAKTGSGKTLVGEYQIYHSLSKGKRVFYTTPIKSLSNQKFNDLKYLFKDNSVGIMTGDIKFCPDAQIVIMTTEILRNLLYKQDTTTEHLGLTASISIDNLDAVIFDECHYINDKDRGKIWEETMILLPSDINLVMLSATLDHPEYFANWLGILKQKPIHLIETQYRIVPLTHHVIDNNYKLIPLMDSTEVYNEKVYIDWLKNRKKQQDDKSAYQRKVVDARLSGFEGAVDGKVHTHSFVHQMNETIKMLEKEQLLPALFFVLSRKQCEAYAKKVEGTLLSTSDTAAVKHIISFHLHRHMNELEKVPQYHQIYDLLCRGIAFHHSGLLPLLKEITEILFSKGFVKIMFCTETFAVGLNMPAKTVLFAGFKKYDDQTGGMRMLRTDEYIQMAGRAGRRGKDDKGIVIYLPDKEPVEPNEMKSMMKGSKPPISSRMDFHYDFILKTIQSSSKNDDNQSMKWLRIMEQSYWFQQRKRQIKAVTKDLNKCEKTMNEVKVEEPYMSECEKRDILEINLKQAVNSARKEIQRQLDTLKNKQLGPKWTLAWTNYNIIKSLKKEYNTLKTDLELLESHKETIDPSVQFLYEIGYLKNNNPLELKSTDLTLKGILATEINEGHQILMTELYTNEYLHKLSGDDLISVLSSFMEEKDSENSPSINELNVTNEVREILYKVTNMAKEFESLESKIGYPIQDYWRISTLMVEPMRRWIEGENASLICKEHGLFEGNFIRSVMKMANMLDEWLSLATYCQHIDQIDKIMEVRQRIIRDIVISDSLYLHL